MPESEPKFSPEKLRPKYLRPFDIMVRAVEECRKTQRIEIGSLVGVPADILYRGADQSLVYQVQAIDGDMATITIPAKNTQSETKTERVVAVRDLIDAILFNEYFDRIYLQETTTQSRN